MISSSILLLFFGTSCTLGWPLPKNVCKSPIGLVSTSKPTTVVGTGTVISCNENALSAALDIGGIVTFNCGSQPVTISITKQLNISRTTDTVIDGNGLVTLDGTGKTRILNFDRGDFRYSNITLMVQGLRFINGNCQDHDGGCAIFQKNGGAISFDGRGRINTICETRFTKNQGNKFGGAFFRVSYNGDEQNNLSYLLIDSNFIPENSKGLAGGLYIQGGTAMIESTTIVNNSATGAAVYCSNPVSGTFTGLTVANNYAGAFGAAFSSCNTEVTLSQSIIAINTIGNEW